MTPGFVKLYDTILTSTVWAESHTTRIVWITMLALSNKDGKVDATLPGLAHMARVTLEECESALSVFAAPDAHSRTPENDGKRIESVPGGWLILNHGAYRQIRTEKQVADTARQNKHREKSKPSVTKRDKRVTPRDKRNVTASHSASQLVAPDTEADTDTDTETTTTKTTNTADSGESGERTISGSRPEPNAVPVPVPRFPVDLCQRLHSVAMISGHVTDYGRFRKALLLLYPASGPLYPEPELAEGLRAFYEAADGMPPREAQFQTIERFVQNVGRWVQLGSMPLANENGVTERGRLAAGVR